MPICTETLVFLVISFNPSCTKGAGGGGLNITLLRMNQNRRNFCSSKFDKQEIGGKLKKSNCPQNVGEGDAQS